MATLSTEKYKLKNGKTVKAYRIICKGVRTPRHTIRIGTVDKQQAETARNRVNALEAARAVGCSIDADTAAWLARIEDWLYDKLVKAELVPPRPKPFEEKTHVVTLGEHLDRLFAARPRQKMTTNRNEQRARKLLEEYFGRERTLESITPADGDDYKAWLFGKFAPSSASVDLRRAKQYLEAARRRRLIPESPFSDLSYGSQTNEDRIEFVPQETINRVIAACPDIEWKLIFAFARYAGVRIPSEIANLKWSDIDWARNRLTLHARKVEHHPGRKYRVVPLFPELRPHLEEAYRERKPDAVYVIPRAHGEPNLGTEAVRIIQRAGVAPWEKVFVNLRGSRADELERIYPTHVVDAWMGNSSRVRRRHYLKVTEADFERAASYPAHYPAHSAAVTGHQEPSTLHEAREKTLDVQKTLENQYPRQGSNL